MSRTGLVPISALQKMKNCRLTTSKLVLSYYVYKNISKMELKKSDFNCYINSILKDIYRERECLHEFLIQLDTSKRKLGTVISGGVSVIKGEKGIRFTGHEVDILCNMGKQDFLNYIDLKIEYEKFTSTLTKYTIDLIITKLNESTNQNLTFNQFIKKYSKFLTGIRLNPINPSEYINDNLDYDIDYYDLIDLCEYATGFKINGFEFKASNDNPDYMKSIINIIKNHEYCDNPRNSWLRLKNNINMLTMNKRYKEPSIPDCNRDNDWMYARKDDPRFEGEWKKYKNM